MKKLIVLSFFSIIGLWLVGLCLFAYTINHYPVDTKTHTQAIVVLTGGRNRISEAVKLLNQGLADKLFISGVEKNTSLQDISDSQDISMPEKNVALEKKSTNTVENAIQTQAWLDKNHITSIRLVTSNYHIPRSLEEFRSLNPTLVIIGHPVYSENVSPKWWKNKGSFCLLASEYNKFLYVYVRNKLKRN